MPRPSTIGLRDPATRAWLRLSAFSIGLTVVGLVTVVFLPISRDDVESLISPLGPLAPAAYVVVSSLLGAVFVPGPLLAAVSGGLFGTWVGFVVSTLGAVLTSVVSALVGRYAVRAPVEQISGERAAALIALARRRSFAVVVLQRWIPGVPDAPFSYLFGALGMGLPAIAVGTVLGAGPRAFVYVALGDAAVTGNAGLAGFAVVFAFVISGIGLLAGAMVTRRHRRRRREAPLETPADSDHVSPT